MAHHKIKQNALQPGTFFFNFLLAKRGRNIQTAHHAYTMITLTRTDSDAPDFRQLVALLDQDLAIRDGEDHAFYAQYNQLDKIKHALVAYLDGQAVGSGAMRAFDPESVEIKRMFVLPAFRGQGVAVAVLGELEKWALELGFSRCILETGKKQPEAIRLYEKSGYTRIPNYGQYAGVENSVCLEKRLPNSRPETEYYFHEDDYCQVELVPIENKARLEASNQEIMDFGEKHTDGIGFTDIYVRDDQQVRTLDRRIEREAFEVFMLGLGFQLVQQVYTGYSQYREHCPNTHAYTQGNAVIFCDFTDGIIANIWLDGFRNTEASEAVAQLCVALREIGGKWGLILNDWNLCMAIDLQDAKQVEAYVRVY